MFCAWTWTYETWFIFKKSHDAALSKNITKCICNQNMVIFSFQFILNLRTKVQNLFSWIQHWHTRRNWRKTHALIKSFSSKVLVATVSAIVLAKCAIYLKVIENHSLLKLKVDSGQMNTEGQQSSVTAHVDCVVLTLNRLTFGSSTYLAIFQPKFTLCVAQSLPSVRFSANGNSRAH